MLNMNSRYLCPKMRIHSLQSRRQVSQLRNGILMRSQRHPLSNLGYLQKLRRQELQVDTKCSVAVSNVVPCCLLFLHFLSLSWFTELTSTTWRSIVPKHLSGASALPHPSTGCKAQKITSSEWCYPFKWCRYLEAKEGDDLSWLGDKLLLNTWIHCPLCCAQISRISVHWGAIVQARFFGSFGSCSFWGLRFLRCSLVSHWKTERYTWNSVYIYIYRYIIVHNYILYII